MKVYLLATLQFLTFCALAQTEPNGQATFNNATEVNAYGMRINWQYSGWQGNVLLKSTQPINATPIDGQVLEIGSPVGNSKVAYIGSAGNADLRETIANTKYYFQLFSYNGNGNNVNYNTSNPTSFEVTSGDDERGNYYANINEEALSFVKDLSQLIRNHQVVNYLDFEETIIAEIYERDTINGLCALNCEYSNELLTYSPPFSFQGVDPDYSREHILARSWMPNGGETDEPEGADYHNLALCNLDDVNSVRSNYPFGNVVSSVQQFEEARTGRDSNNDIVYEPRQSFKGDVARALFYQQVAYNGENGNWGINNLLGRGDDQVVQVLLDWHAIDPVSSFEIARHEFVASIQNNRNPFIDNPEWVDCINFSDLSLSGNCPVDSTINYLGRPIGQNEVKIEAHLHDGWIQIIHPNKRIQGLSLNLLNGQNVDFTFDKNTGTTTLSMTCDVDSIVIVSFYDQLGRRFSKSFKR